MIAWLQTLTIQHYLIVAISIIIILVLLIFLIKFVKIKIKTKDIEISNSGASITEPENFSIVQHIEVRDYNGLLYQLFDQLKTDIAIRIRRNGWLSIENFKEYCEQAYKIAETTMIQFLDEHYYIFSLVERSELHDWNMQIVPQVKSMFIDMYQRIYDINLSSSKKVNSIKSELDKIKTNRICEPTSDGKCYNILDVIRLVTEMMIEENVTCKDSCMIEANRILKELKQIFNEHYKTIYRKKIAEKKEGKK